MCTFIDHSDYEKDTTLSCDCQWRGQPEDCYSQLYAAFMDVICPNCRETIMVIDTLGTEHGTFVPRPVPRLTARRRRVQMPLAFFF